MNPITLAHRASMSRKMTSPSKIKCRVCKSLFVPKAVTSVLCSDRCRAQNRRDWVEDNLKRRREHIRSISTPKNCKLCDKEFYIDKYNKVFCSRPCANTYNKTRKRGMPTVKEQGIEPVAYYRSYIIKGNNNLNTVEKKALHRQELGEATERFLRKGGKIEKLDPSPLPKIPSVGSREWEWELTVGLGFFGSEEITDPVTELPLSPETENTHY